MKTALAIIIAGLLILTGTVFYTNQTPKAVYTAPTQATEPLNADTIFNLVNQERIKAGVKPLVRDARLDATAQERADDMVARNYFSHFDPVTGEGMIDKQEPGCVQGENIINVGDLGEKNTEAINWWINSPAHYKAMTNPDYDITGIAVNGNIGVQHFCSK